MAQAPVRVLVVEDHPVVAEGLKLVLDRASAMAVVGVADSVAAADRLSREQQPDVAVIDYHLPDGTGADAAAAIRRRAPGAALLVLSADASDEAMLASIEAGVSGYVVKSEAAAQIVDSVRRVAAGEMLISPATLAGLLARQRQRAGRAARRESLVKRLTPREREVLALMARGLDNRTMAERLDISLATARAHVQSIIEKLEAHSKLEAVVRANEFRLLEG